MREPIENIFFVGENVETTEKNGKNREDSKRVKKNKN